MVERTPRRRHHDVDATLERPQLTADWLAAVNRQNTHLQIAPVAAYGLGDLHRELARRDEHQGERFCPLDFPEYPLEDGKREGGRLPRPGRGLPDQITALKQGRDSGLLYRSRFLIAEAGQTFESTLTTIRDVADAVLHQLTRLAVSPQEVRVEFGLELTAKAAALVASASATAQLHVTLAWNPTHDPSTQPTQG